MTKLPIAVEASEPCPSDQPVVFAIGFEKPAAVLRERVQGVRIVRSDDVGDAIPFLCGHGGAYMSGAAPAMAGGPAMKSDESIEGGMMALTSVAETEALLRERMVPLAAYRASLEGEPFLSPWLTVDQSMIDRFAVATHDHQFIHVEPERAKAETPYGGTIAHGFLTLSLLSTLAYEAIPGVVGTRMGMNYGFDKVRFLNPVKAGARVRGRFQMVGLTERAVSLQTAWDAAVEIEGAIKPALTAHWITLTVITPPED